MVREKMRHGGAGNLSKFTQIVYFTRFHNAIENFCIYIQRLDRLRWIFHVYLRRIRQTQIYIYKI